MILLYEENETLFESLGLGLLKDAKSCTVSEVLNDSFDLELQYPIIGANFSKIALNRIILAKSSPYSKAQPFRIYSISKPINGVITVRAFHISYDMNGIVVAPISGGTPKLAIDQIQNKAITEHSFKFYTDITENKSFKTSNYYNMRSLLMGSEQSILETYEGEILFDKFNVYILKQRGSNKGASVRYAKNMQDLTHEVNYERLYNGVYPFYHQETTETTTTTTPDGFKQVFIVGHKPFQDGWLSYEADGEPYHPIDESPVQIATEGDYYEKVYCWNPTTQRYVEKVYNEMVNIIDCVTGLLTPSEKPNWIYIDVTALPKIVVKANADGYFKLATDDDWTKRNSGEIVFEGSVTTVKDNLIMFYSEVIPSDTTVSDEETTTVTHIELKDKILWLDTPAAKDMKYDRILCLDLTSEFNGEAPTEDELRTKANEYIEKNKIGQYKYDTKVSFIDLRSTTEGTKYEKMETIELGDFVKVTYEDLGVDVELRVVSTKYNVLLNRYDSIDLGEKSEKISASSVQTGDDVSSLTNDVGYADVSTVNKLVAKMITAEYIKAKNAELSKAQIEELQTARIRCSGIIEATQFELDTLVAKMLTADNAVIKQTLEAGTVKVKGDITVTKGSISIENTESGTVFNVDRDGNVTANSVKITGGELNINDTFTVTPEGILTALGADIRGRIEAESGLIASFTIESTESTEGKSNRLYSGTPGQSGSVLVSPGYNIRISSLDNDEETRDSHNWAFLAGDSFGVDDQGNLYSNNAYIEGTIIATAGEIGGFYIAEDKLWNTYVEVSPTQIVYGQNEEFKLTSAGILKIQNANTFSVVNWTIIPALAYEPTLQYTVGDYCIFTNKLYICKENTLGTPSHPQSFNALYWTKIDISNFDAHTFYHIGDYCKNGGFYYICSSPVGYQYITLDNNGLTAKSIYVENAEIKFGRIGGFTIGQSAIYKEIKSFDADGSSNGVYLGPDGLRIGKNLKIYSDGRIMSGSRNYSEDIIYKKDDLCIFNNSLLKCIVDQTTGGVFNASEWEEISMCSFGIDDTGRLTASSATIIGNITAESGYIGSSTEGFTITSTAIYNGFDDPNSNVQDTGVYIGTDAIRLGKKVSQTRIVTFYTLNFIGASDIKNINETDKDYIGAEFILSYDPKPYDRYLEIKETYNPDGSSSQDYPDEWHIYDPKFVQIIGKTLNDEEEFDIKNNEYIYININNSKLWSYDTSSQQYVFSGVILNLYYGEINTITYVGIDFFNTEEDWINGTNPHSRSSDLNFGTVYNFISLTISNLESPWFRLKIKSGETTIRNCYIREPIRKIVLLEANTSEMSFTASKYSNIYIRYHNTEGEEGVRPITNITLTLKVLPGFLVTKDGFMNAYNAKIWGHFEGNVNIHGGSIIIEDDNSTKTFEVTVNGDLYANSGYFGDSGSGFKLDSNSLLHPGKTAYNYNSSVTYNIGDPCLRNGTRYICLENGVTGTWNSSKWYASNSDIGTNESVVLCSGSAGTARIAGSANISGWAITAGAKFGVTKDGHLYATNATLSGYINSQSGKIANLDISSDGLSYSYDGTVKFSLYPANEGGSDPREPHYALKCSSALFDKLVVSHGSGGGNTYQWLEFIPHYIVVNSSSSAHDDHVKIPIDYLLKFVVSLDGDWSKCRNLVYHELTRVGKDYSWTSGNGVRILWAMACFAGNSESDPIPDHPLILDWSNTWHSTSSGGYYTGTYRIRCNAAESRRNFKVIMLVEKADIYPIEN